MRGALASTTCSSSSAAVPRSSSSSCIFGRPLFNHATSSPKPRLSLLPFKIRLRVLNDYTRKGSGMSSDPTMEISEVDKLVDGMDFGELCNDFECKSSPSVESTARQLARDILELRQGNRALGTFSVSVKYKTVQEMLMLSTSVLSIKWTIKGKPKFFALANVGDLIIIVNSLFTLNQISGQVIEHEELWDLSASSAIGRAYFWTSRRLFAAIESGKDVVDAVKDKTSNLSMQKENLEIFPDPSGDPTKFFQRDDGFQRDAYQIALFLAVVYFVVQFLRTTL
eukprot:TRINITY_DN6336_c1_g2_i4.p1 TRINITY_DN6336_c1_g2~~TRINITY_DN6336_c1_g2_i4.p1  ORF type:complete len:282 (+),score=62.11 TRINITY_DN6336_c1_g2_i4:252-1097(+)